VPKAAGQTAQALVLGALSAESRGDNAERQRLLNRALQADPDFAPSRPELVLTTDFHNSSGLSFDVSADGQRFLVNRPVVAGQPNEPLRVIRNWTSELD